LGSGFLEAVYQEALEREFNYQKIPNKSHPQVRIEYKGEPLKKKYEPDFICYDDVIVEIKAMNKLSSNEYAQIINYLKAAKFKVGLLINFGSKSLERKRFVNNFFHLKK
ncbi:MAG: GxxExxY protein, partial [Desulfobacterales bacterium]